MAQTMNADQADDEPVRRPCAWATRGSATISVRMQSPIVRRRRERP